MHLHKVRRSRHAERHARCDNHKVPVFDKPRFLRLANRVVNEVVGVRHHFLCHKRNNAPRHRSLAHCGFACRAGNNRALGTIARNHTRGRTRFRHGYDCSRAEVNRRAYRRVGNRSRNVHAVALLNGVKPLLVVDSLFRCKTHGDGPPWTKCPGSR